MEFNKKQIYENRLKELEENEKNLIRKKRAFEKKLAVIQDEILFVRKKIHEILEEQNEN